MMDRRKHLMVHVDVAGGKGLEIGPLRTPTVTRELGEIYYLDHASTEELREKYRGDPEVNEAEIVDVDFVWGTQTMLEATAAAAPFDYVVAAHVLEHVPDFAGWLGEVESVLRPGGRLSLCLPDRRYTFDVRRRPTQLADIVEAHLLGLRRPALRATFDHFHRHVPVDTVARWRGEVGHDDPPLDAAKAMALTRAALDGEYVDTHCWVFADNEFLDLLRETTELGLVRMRLVGFEPTSVDGFEFFATLERLPDGLSAEERTAACLAALDLFRPTPEPGADDGSPFGLSAAERRAIVLKRRVARIGRRVTSKALRETSELRSRMRRS